MADLQNTPTTTVIDGITYTVPSAFAGLYEYYRTAGAGGGPNILAQTVGEFETYLPTILDLIQGYNWKFIKSVMEQYGTADDPENAEGYATVSAFAAGDFSIIEQAIEALRNFLAPFPDSTSVLVAFADLEGYDEALEDGLQKFLESVQGQVIEGTGDFDIVGFSAARSAYSISVDGSGAVTITGPSGGSATLSGIEKLTFSDVSYNLQIAVKASTISPEALNSLVDLYVAYFNRVPEAGGLAYWIDQVAAGKSLANIAADFYAAGIQYSDTTGYTADMPIADFIGVLYQNVLARTGANAPTDAEIEYWVDEVTSGNVSREGLVARFLNDARLFYDDATVGYVPRLLDQKVEFGKVHAILFGLDYNDSAASIQETVALAAAVTSTGYENAVGLVGLSSDDYLPA